MLYMYSGAKLNIDRGTNGDVEKTGNNSLEENMLFFAMRKRRKGEYC